MRIVPLSAPRAEAGDRCSVLVELLRRCSELAGEISAGEEPPAVDIPAALRSLAEGGMLSFAEAEGGIEVLYTPSRSALRSLAEAGAPQTFPEPVHKKQVEALRTSQGALFRFPYEEGGGHLDVFITDWSPCPAAGAVAVHRHHPFVADLPKPAASFFTGRFVRHPLTGDLLPVWVADWVRPGFGTGAVLVNPAHDPVDLAFARAVGLPIRFALVPEGCDGSPETWPVPPVVRTGTAVRTGAWDDLAPQEAMRAYFDVLRERGLAEPWRDVQAGRRRIGRLVPDAAGELAWNPVRSGLAAEPGDGTARVRLDDADLLATALGAAGSPAPVLVCPAGELTGSLLFLRLLSFDLGTPLAPARVFVVQKVQESCTAAAPEVLRLAGLVGAPLHQVAVLKQQVVEQVQRFLRVHRELLAALDGAPLEAGAAPAPRVLQQCKAAIVEGDPAKAFSFLQQEQKQLGQLAPDRRARDEGLAGYFAVAHALAGLELPPGLDVRRAWRAL